MKTNRVISYSDGDKFDISDMAIRQRIVLSVKNKKFILKSSVQSAKNEQKTFADDAVVVSSSQCCSIFPSLFYKEGWGSTLNNRIILLLTDDQRDFLKSKGNVNGYIRSLIDKAMGTDNVTDGD